MIDQAATLQRVFHALADPTRRAVVERLGRGAAPVSELAEPFDMALPSFMQHLKVLEAAKLVATKKTGRVRTCRLLPESLVAAENWMSAQRALWNRRLDQMDEYLYSLKNLPAGESPKEHKK
jgi:DNA-binding transcriptional ArsR family regulator